MADTNKLDSEKPRKKKKGKMERVVGGGEERATRSGSAHTRGGQHSPIFAKEIAWEREIFYIIAKELWFFFDGNVIC